MGKKKEKETKPDLLQGNGNMDNYVNTGKRAWKQMEHSGRVKKKSSKKNIDNNIIIKQQWRIWQYIYAPNLSYLLQLSSP